MQLIFGFYDLSKVCWNSTWLPPEFSSCCSKTNVTLSLNMQNSCLQTEMEMYLVLSHGKHTAQFLFNIHIVYCLMTNMPVWMGPAQTYTMRCILAKQGSSLLSERSIAPSLLFTFYVFPSCYNHPAVQSRRRLSQSTRVGQIQTDYRAVLKRKGKMEEDSSSDIVLLI